MDVTLEIKRGSKKTREVKLRLEDTLVGRQDGCDMRIPSAAVSRKHCRLRFRDGYLSVEDLKSSNGTFVNGQRVSGMQPIRPGDLLEIGPVTFLVKYELSSAAASELDKRRTHVEDIVDVEPIDDDEIVDLEPVDDQKQTVEFNLQKVEEASKKPAAKKPAPKTPAPKTRPATTPPPLPQESEDDVSPAELSEIFSAPFTIPVEEDLRDLLAGLDDSKKD